VDDGSGDESLIELIIKQQRPDTRVVKLTRNFGAVHSSKAGLNYVTGDCTMWLSADLQYPPELTEMTDQWLAGLKTVTTYLAYLVLLPLIGYAIAYSMTYAAV
jgi:glycosyltransferase involved in cell wall biosynthesis